nr:transposase [Rhizobium sp. CFBP 8762]
MLAEVQSWTRFLDSFTHYRIGETASDEAALMATILADATNAGAERMAESDLAPQVLSSFEFAPAVLCCCILCGSGVLRCGAVSAAQHRITSRVDGLSELGWCEPAEAGVWSMVVVVVAPTRER